MRRRITLVPALIGLLFLPALAYGQDGGPGETLKKGRRSLEFSLPEGGGGLGFGFWSMRSDVTNLGLGMRLTAGRSAIENGPVATTVSLEVGPEVRRYLELTTAPVAPYLFGGATVDVVRNGSGGGIMHTRFGGALSAGFGVEWFPARRIGIGGYTGARVSYEREVRDVDDTTMSQLALGTFTSGLTLNIYFGGPASGAEPSVATERN